MALGRRHLRLTATPSEQPVSTQRGALPIGQASYSPPVGAVYVATTGNDTTGNGTILNPYRTFAKGVAMVTIGGTIVLRGGEYHEGGLSVGESSPGLADGSYTLGIQLNKANVTVQNYPGEAVWFDGSKVVSGWVVDGSQWRLDNYTPRFPRDLSNSQWDTTGQADLGDKFVNAAYPTSYLPDNMWLDGVEQYQVATKAEATAGKFYVDQTAQKVWMGSNPTGKTVRMSYLSRFMTVLGDNCLIRGIGIKRYAPSLAESAISMNRLGCTIENCHVTENSTKGLESQTRANMVIRYCTVTYNGCLGISAWRADGLIVDGCVVNYNNWRHFDTAPQAGGLKSTKTMVLTVRNSDFKYNVDSTGLWLDETVYDAYIYSNNLQDNDASGLNIEICGKAIVANNLITGNKGTQWHITGTDKVRAWNNTCAGNDWECLAILQDNRTPFNADGTDSRQPASFYTTEMTWQITTMELCNNVFGKSQYAPLRIKQYNYSSISPNPQPSKGWAAFGITSNGNLFNRYTDATRAQPGTLVTSWTTGTPGSEQYWSSLSAWRAGSTAAGRSADANSVEISGSNALDANWMLTPAAQVATAGAAISLPADIAALIGQSAGTNHIGCWR